MKVSLVVTVFNEEGNITKLVTALKHQTRLPDEVIIVDGGSTDKTYSELTHLAKSWSALRVFLHPGNRSVGRNFGVSRSSGQIIAFTDAGCYPDPDWLSELLRPFSHPLVEVSVVSGYYRGSASGAFQKNLLPFVLVMPDKALTKEFFPSTRSMAITRKAWQLSGGFDPSLYHNEDYAFAHTLKRLGFIFWFAPRAVVNWLPRKNLRSAAWMFTRFAIGDIQAGIIRPQLTRLAVRFWLFAFLFFLSLEIRFLFFIFVPLIIVYFIAAIWKNYRYVGNLTAVFWLPVIQVIVDGSVLFGSLVGILSKQWLTPKHAQ